MNSPIYEIPLWAWVLLPVILLIQAFWIFQDAKKRGLNPWPWGALGLLNFPGSLITYLLVVSLIERRRRR